MLYEMKTIKMWPFIKVSFVVNSVVGFIFGVFYAMFMGLFFSAMQMMPGFPADEFQSADVPVGLFVVIMPVLCAIMFGVGYTLFGMIGVAVYNLFARLIGGLEFEVAPTGGMSAAVMPPHAPQMPQTAPPPHTYVSPYPGYSPPSTSSGAISPQRENPPPPQAG